MGEGDVLIVDRIGKYEDVLAGKNAGLTAMDEPAAFAFDQEDALVTPWLP